MTLGWSCRVIFSCVMYYDPVSFVNTHPGPAQRACVCLGIAFSIQFGPHLIFSSAPLHCFLPSRHSRSISLHLSHPVRLSLPFIWQWTPHLPTRHLLHFHIRSSEAWGGAGSRGRMWAGVIYSHTGWTEVVALCFDLLYTQTAIPIALYKDKWCYAENGCLSQIQSFLRS